jgi:uncharacterized membrane protein YfcA
MHPDPSIRERCDAPSTPREMNDALALMPPWALAAALVVTFAGGFVKGAVGFAMPLVMISGLSLFLEPTVAIAGVILPIVVSNFMQVARYGLAEAKSAVAEYWRYILIVCVTIVIVAQFVPRISTQTMYLVIGVPVVILSLIQLLGLRFHVGPEHRRLADWGIGALAGGLGGLTGTWGPPTVLYLLALDTPEARQMLVQGVVYGLGSVSLLAGHLKSGVLNATTAPFSAALLIPAFLGMRAGFRLHEGLDPDVFRRITLVVLVIAGANLVRRGLTG